MPAPAIRLPKPKYQQATNNAYHLPAPTGGINAFDPASAMPPTDCLSLWNLIPYQYGLRSRSGWREWCTNVGSDTAGLGFYDDGSPMEFSLAAPLGGAVVGAWPGVTRDGVRTIMAFYGSSPSGDRLFACTADGIYDCTHSTSSPTLDYQFPIGTYTDPATGNVIHPRGPGPVSIHPLPIPPGAITSRTATGQTAIYFIRKRAALGQKSPITPQQDPASTDSTESGT